MVLLVFACLIRIKVVRYLGRKEGISYISRALIREKCLCFSLKLTILWYFSQVNRTLHISIRGFDFQHVDKYDCRIRTVLIVFVSLVGIIIVRYLGRKR